MLADRQDKKSHLIRSALLASEWKKQYGHAVQIGVEGHVDDLNQIAHWLKEKRDRDILAVDNLRDKKSSLLDNLKSQEGAHYHVPRSMQGNVRLYTEAPKLFDPVLFLHVTTSNRAEIEPFAEHIKPGTIIVGSVDACRVVLDAAQCQAQPLYFHAEFISLRVVA